MTQIFVRRGGNETGGTKAILDATANLTTGESKFKSEYGGITSLEADLLLIASTIYSADRCSKRGEREDSPRDIQLSIPVINIGRLQPEAPRIEGILRKLSSDAWSISFRQVSGKLEEFLAIAPAHGKTLLFSGGLDSLAAAVELGMSGETLQLVSHNTHNQPTALAQQALVSMMTSRLGLTFTHRRFMVTAKSSAPSPELTFDAESSQRTRSFLFLTLAALCARRVGHNEVIMVAENGQMAIHLPISAGRIGPFSTKTAHPDVLRLMELFLNSVLQTSIRIQNPYVNKTKAETIAPVVANLPGAIPVSSSCWKNARLAEGKTHCGFCIPCIVRRIAIEFHGLDSTAYARNLFADDIAALGEDDDGRRNLVDYAEFMQRVSAIDISESTFEWPELISDSINVSDAIAMYRRAAIEAKQVLGTYGGLTPLLQ